MKRLALFIAGLLAVANVASAQSTASEKTSNSIGEYMSVGPVIGMGNSWVGHMGGDNKFMPAANLGVGFVYARNQHWGWGGQLLFATEGYNVNYNGYNAMATTEYLRLPLSGYYFFGDYKNIVRPKIFLGPEFGLKLGEQDSRDYPAGEYMLTQRTGSFRTLDFGLNGGVGVNVKLMRAMWLNIDMGYYQGLTDVIKDPAGRYNVNHNLGMNAGVLFGIR